MSRRNSRRWGCDRRGDGGSYLQRVPLLSYAPANEGTLTWTPTGRAAQRLVFGTDYVPAGDPRAAATRLDAPVGSVGHGVSVPKASATTTIRASTCGKIVAFTTAAPKLGDPEVEASFTRDARLVEAQRRGAVGAVILADLASGRGPGFAALAKRWDRPAVTWAKVDGTGGGAAARGVPVAATLSPAGAAKLFGARWAAVSAAATAETPRFTSVALPGRLSAAIATRAMPLTSNVAGIIPGTDPTIGKEVVVLAHLDHIGAPAGRR
ncbi:hypothetical protein AB5I41_19140 [Sphingomonas sp. MMS24-JH45]